MLKSFISLVYPNVCLGCGKPMAAEDRSICLYCKVHLPRTFFESEPGNFVEKLFWAKVDLEAATAHYFFHKASTIQRLMHHLKYLNKPEVGRELGYRVGLGLKQAPRFRDVDFLLPIPLHKKKLKKRGYNQAEEIALGMAESMGATCMADCLLRKVHTETQTNKSTFDRWKNVHSIFTLQHPERLQGKHVLLVDDVVTTGSTLQAAAYEIKQQLTAVRVSVATVAVAWR